MSTLTESDRRTLRAALDRALIAVNATSCSVIAAERSGDVDRRIAACEEHKRAYVVFCAAYLAYYPTRTVPLPLSAF